MGDAGPALDGIWGPTLMKCGRQGFPLRADPEGSHLGTCQKTKANTQYVSYRGPLGYLSDQHLRERANKNDCAEGDSRSAGPAAALASPLGLWSLEIPSESPRVGLSLARTICS